MSQTAGVKPMTIAGRVASERERCLGMTDQERAWRKQWLKDQILDSTEPIEVPEYWKERTNIIRRIYRFPLDTVFGALSGVIGKQRATDYRWIVGKLTMMGFGALAIHYYFKYNGNDWTQKGGWRVLTTKPTVLPGQEGFPFKSKRCSGRDYADRRFSCSVIYPEE